ncbi:hypothetical protein [Porphyromonas loveana]|uniref:hypothetical protein n=1 Tax=Porphyromonas loveana TaxID=1884669 RepID=UPI0035A0ACDF
MAFKEEFDSFHYEIALAAAIPYVKDIKATSICPVHHKKRISINYDNDDTGIYAYVSKGCCPEFRRLVADALRKTERFDIVYIEE